MKPGIYTCSLHDVRAELWLVRRYPLTAKRTFIDLRTTYAFFRTACHAPRR